MFKNYFSVFQSSSTNVELMEQKKMSRTEK